jgi:two-component system, LytTR family, sensor kinase
MKTKYHIIFWICYVVYALFADIVSYPDFDIRIFLIFLLTNHIYCIYSSIFLFNRLSFSTFLLGMRSVCLIVTILAVFCLIRFVYIFHLHPFLTSQKPKEISLVKYFTNAMIFYARFAFAGLAYFFAMKYIRREKDIYNTKADKMALENRNLELELQNKEFANNKLKADNENMFLQMRNDELLKEKLESENEALRAQINPHFLFNTLNFFFSKTLKLDKDVANGIHSLSTIMRGAFAKPDADGLIDLNREIEMIEKLIEIYTYRFDNNVEINFSKSLAGDFRIIPNVLVTLVENSLKHGDLEDEKNPICIKVSSSIDRFVFLISNKKIGGEKYSTNGIGLNFVRRRLQTVYGEKHKFTISDVDEIYTTELSIVA